MSGRGGRKNSSANDVTASSLSSTSSTTASTSTSTTTLANSKPQQQQFRVYWNALVSFFAGAFTILLLLPYLPLSHVAPALTPATLPPLPLYKAVMGTVGHLDSVLNTLTPPNLLLFRHTMGFLHTVELYTAASLKIADILHTEKTFSSSSSSAYIPVSVLAAKVTNCSAAAPDQVAANCQSVALRLTRLLRACAAYGVFTEGPTQGGNSWKNTVLSDYLRGDHPDSLRAVVLNFGGVQYKMMAYMPEAIASGVPSFAKAYDGEDFWAWYDKHPVEHGIFDATMAQLGRLGGADAAIAKDVPWTSFADVLVDIGGGYGEMLATILKANPKLEKGVVFDIPHVIDRTARLWKKGPYAKKYTTNSNIVVLPGSAFSPSTDPELGNDRVDLVQGDMFDPSTIPSVISSREREHAIRMKSPTGDPATSLEKCTHSAAPRHGYVLRDIVHDWNDVDTVRILKSLRAVIRGNESACYGSDGTKLIRTAPLKQQYKDRVLIVGRVIVPGASFIQSMGTNDADMVMLGAFGTTAGERTVEHFTRLFNEAGLELVAVHPTRSHYSILEARAQPTPLGWGYTGTDLRASGEESGRSSREEEAAVEAEAAAVEAATTSEL